MSNVSLQVERTTAGTVASGENVIFDSISSSTGDISYDALTGVITFNEAGRYSIKWWVATQASQAAAAVFALTSSQGDYLEGNSPIKTGEVVGFGIVDVTSPPITVSLVNESSSIFYFSVIVPLTANLVVIQEDTTGGPTGSSERRIS